MRPLPSWLRQHVAAFRALVVLTAVTVVYTIAVTGVAQLPGLRSKADGSLVRAHGRVVGSSLIGQSFTAADGTPLARYFQSRPSDAGAAGYDPTASGGSNLGPESVVDVLANPARRGDHGKPSLLSQVCARSLAVGREFGVDGLRPYCTTTGVGAVLSVIRSNGRTGRVVRVVSVNQECPATPFVARYDGVRVGCARYGASYAAGRLVLVHGPGRPWPANPVPPDAVTASGSGLDPDISLAYARLQVDAVARARHLPAAVVRRLVEDHVVGRALGFMGEPYVDVLDLNVALDRIAPTGASAAGGGSSG